MGLDTIFCAKIILVKQKVDQKINKN